MLQIEKQAQEIYPDLHFGLMVMREVQNPPANSSLVEAKKKLEDELQKQFSGQDKKDLRQNRPISDYHSYYKKFKKTYHVLHQLESIANNKRSIPDSSALVSAMFMAEVQNQLLTAGYDLASLNGPFKVHLADGESSFEGMGKKLQTPPKNDLVFSDTQKDLGSIICGPNHVDRISSKTTDVVFVVYGVPGVSEEQIANHLSAIKDFVKLVSPAAKKEILQIC